MRDLRCAVHFSTVVPGALLASTGAPRCSATCSVSSGYSPLSLKETDGLL